MEPDFILDGRSLTNKENSVGPSTDPCGIATDTGIVSDLYPLKPCTAFSHLNNWQSNPLLDLKCQSSCVISPTRPGARHYQTLCESLQRQQPL